MITIGADALSTLLNKVTPHCPGDDVEERDVVVLDYTPNWLHAAAGGVRTVAIARATVDGASGTHWTAPVSSSDITVLSAWLATSSRVHVGVELTVLGPLMHFSEGNAKLTVPFASYALDLPWRAMLRAGAHRSGILLRDRAVVVSADSDFVVFQVTAPRPVGSHGDVLEDWAESARTQTFAHQDETYEVGTPYVDDRGMLWRIPVRPAPYEEPKAVRANASGAVFPLSAVIQAGGHLRRAPRIWPQLR
ncbi:hypothetical protein [Streptomyces sp. NPDC095613]|uniref:hypothetical protein n=1 Tax=Streptomyces sp. NPDC095613 TaxID=3155540 RepID=UPI00331D2E35